LSQERSVKRIRGLAKKQISFCWERRGGKTGGKKKKGGKGVVHGGLKIGQKRGNLGGKALDPGGKPSQGGSPGKEKEKNGWVGALWTSKRKFNCGKIA